MKGASAFWTGKRVLVTGHTGFKGGWLTLWLERLGAKVTGLALPADTEPCFFSTTQLAQHCRSHFVDIRDAKALGDVVDACDPQIVFHLAAQALVLRSYAEPLQTWQTNVMGTIHLLETLRHRQGVGAVVVVTSDKCYENDGTHDRRFVETDALGGRDPYSSSKAAAELVTASWRASFFSPGVGLASARAGNVIGGGDWSEGRLIPDVIRSLKQHAPLTLRYPAAIRPWQHVLEPLAGYLMLARALYNAPTQFSSAWNFGPDPGAQLAVEDVVKLIARLKPELAWSVASEALHEAPVLQLDSAKATRELGWRPKWSACDALSATLDWYDGYGKGASMADLSLAQIEQYTALAAREAL